MSSHKIYYTDRNNQPQMHEFYGSDYDANRWARYYEQSTGRPVEVYQKDYYTGKVSKMESW